MTAIINSNILELAGLFSQYLVTTHGDENLFFKFINTLVIT